MPKLTFPKLLLSAESEYNGKIEVYQIGNTVKLIVGGIVQSLSKDSQNAKRLVWGRVLEVLKQNEPNLKNIIIFGLGGGTMPHLISQAHPGVYITSVDIDKVMIDVAKQYFGVEQIPNHHIINADACRLVIEPTAYGINKQSFQVAIVDIYVGDNYPDLGKSGNFVAALKDIVVPGGLIIFNRIYTKHHQEDVNIFMDFLQGFLHDIQTLTVAGYTNSDNILIYGRS